MTSEAESELPDRLRALVGEACTAAEKKDVSGIYAAFARAPAAIDGVEPELLDGAQAELFTIAQNLAAMSEVDGALLFYDALRRSVTAQTESGADWLWTAYYAMGDYLFGLGRIDEAEHAYRSSAGVAQEYFGFASNQYIDAALGVSAVLRRRGDYLQIIEILEGLRPFVKKHRGEANQRYLDLTRDLGLAFDQRGNYYEAESLYRDWLRLASYLYGPAHDETISALYHVAELARVREDYEEAEPTFRRVLELKLVSGNQDSTLARIQNNYAEVLAAIGRFDNALPLFEAALALRTKLFGAKSSEVARTLAALGEHEVMEGRHDQGLPHLEQAKAIYDSLGSERDHADMDTTLLLAGIITDSNNLPEAGDVAALEDEVRRMSEAYGRLHPQLLVPLLNVATMRAERREWSEMRTAIEHLTRVADERLIEIVGSASMYLAGKFAERYADVTELWLLLVAYGPATDSDRQAAYACVQRRKGIQTRMLRIAQPGGDLMEAFRSQEREVDAEPARARHAMMLRALFEGSDTNAPELRRLRLEQDAWERARARGTPSGRLEKEIAFANDGSARLGLGNDEAIVEFASFYDPFASDPAMRGRRYVVFIVRKDQETLGFAVLGKVDEIDDAVHDLRAAIGEGANPATKRRPEWLRLARFLYGRIVKPWLKSVEGIADLRVAPEDTLALLPFELLASAEDRYLIDDFRVAYLLYGSETFRLSQFFGLVDPPVVIADPDFDAAAPVSGDEKSSEYFPALPGSREEGEFVAARLGVAPSVGMNAVEALLGGTTRPEIVHIATHGFVLSASEPGLQANAYLARRAALPDPLDRCGLALAGANRTVSGNVAPPEDRDGLLFASELLYTDFRRTDLVVLAACRSAEGDVVRGDTVHGLRRAFKAGGAHSVVCSLWNIPDGITRRIMTRFYDRLLAEARRIDALHEVRMEIRREHPREPMLWAGIILDGDTGALRRFDEGSHLKFVEIESGLLGRTAQREKEEQEIPEQIGERLLREARREGRGDDPEKALPLLDEAMGLQVSADLLARCRYERAGILRASGSPGESVPEYNRLLETEALAMELRIAATYDRSTAFFLLGRLNEAEPGLTQLLDSIYLDLEHRVKILVNRSACYLQMARFDEAIADATAVIKTPAAARDQIRMALGNRAQSRRLSGDARGTIDDASRALDFEGISDSERVGLSYARSLTRAAVGDVAGAVADFDLLLKLWLYGTEVAERAGGLGDLVNRRKFRAAYKKMKSVAEVSRRHAQVHELVSAISNALRPGCISWGTRRT